MVPAGREDLVLPSLHGVTQSVPPYWSASRSSRPRSETDSGGRVNLFSQLLQRLRDTPAHVADADPSGRDQVAMSRVGPRSGPGDADNVEEMKQRVGAAVAGVTAIAVGLALWMVPEGENNPTVQEDLSDKTLLFYNGRSETQSYQIGVAVKQGGRFVPRVEPVFGPGSWDSDHVKDPYVVRRGDTLHLFYAGHDGTRYEIGRAVGDGLTWDRSDKPLLPPSTGWDSGATLFPVVLYDEHETEPSKRWKMWYAGRPSTAVRGASIGYAYSSDGRTWTRHPQPVIELDGAIDLAPGAIYRTRRGFHLFYGRRYSHEAPQRDRVFVARFSDPTGEYRTHQILRPRWGAHTTITEDAETRAVRVASTEPFYLGEPVWLWDADSAPLLVEVEGKTPNTLILDRDLPDTYSEGGLVRSNLWGSLSVRSVVKQPEGFVAYGTAFQAVHDLNVAYLRESSVSFVAEKLRGPWTIRIGKGLVIPLDGGWDSISAENPNVVLP